MARHRTAEEWAQIRAEREGTGASFPELAAKYGLTHQAIQKRAKADGWGDGTDGNETANKIAREKVAGIVAASNPIARMASIADAADKKASVIRAQQADWELHRAAYCIDGAEERERLQCAKLAAEVLKLRHEGERKAYNISDAVEPPKPQELNVVLSPEEAYKRMLSK